MTRQINQSVLEILRQDGHPVNNRFFRQSDPAHGLAVLFPGLRYTCDQPLLHYTTLTLTHLGMDVLQLWPDFTGKDFSSLSQSDQVFWYLEDAGSALQGGLGQGTYDQVVLIGKSIGTLPLALLAGDSSYEQATTIWLTPLLNISVVANAASSLRSKALIAGGTGDTTFDLQIVEAIQADANTRVLIFEGADHSLEVSGSPQRSIQILGELMESIQELLS